MDECVRRLPRVRGRGRTAGPNLAEGDLVMKKDEIEVGGIYLAKVGTRMVEVRVERENGRGGGEASRAGTGQPVRLKDAKPLRPVKAAKAAKAAEPGEAAAAAAPEI